MKVTQSSIFRQTKEDTASINQEQNCKGIIRESGLENYCTRV